jgi:hypothetical protein
MLLDLMTLRFWHHGREVSSFFSTASDELKDTVTNESVELRLFLASTGYWKWFIVSRDIHGGQIGFVKLLSISTCKICVLCCSDHSSPRGKQGVVGKAGSRSFPYYSLLSSRESSGESCFPLLE